MSVNNPFFRLNGKITSISADGIVTIKAMCNNIDAILRKECKNVSVEFIDSRKITNQQRKMVWALIGEIAEWQGESKSQTMKEMINEAMKLDFIFDELNEDQDKMFSLSNAPISVVCSYQKYLIDFIIENGIQTSVPLAEYADDIMSYIYSCVTHKRCSVCGDRAEIHHIDRVGMGRNRKDIVHIGMEALPLCRYHHMEAHTMPDKDFFEKYHLEKGITLDKKLCDMYKLNTGGE